MEAGVFMAPFRGAGRILSAVALAASFSWLTADAYAVPVSARGESGSARSTLSELAAKLPLRFEENVGQVRQEGIRYFARGRGYRLFLSPGEAVFSLDNPGKPAEKTVRLHLAGGAEHPALTGIEPLPTKTNYLLGKDPRAWHTGVSSFAGVRYEKVYPGTDLVFSGNDRRVEQSFFLAAGAEPRRIHLVYEGATAAEVGKAGELVVRTPGGELTADRPVAYQVIDGERRPVACRYELLAHGVGAPTVGFALGAYDSKIPLVIDPVFNNSTFLGGADSDTGTSVAVDGAGNVYVAGVTFSTDFPGTVTPGGVQPANAGSADGFVAKIDPTGTTLLYSTYFGGDDLDSITGIAVDSAGNAYLTGFTDSSNFPVTAGTLQGGNAGGPGDVFVAKLSPAGSSLLYSTYLGGTGSDIGSAIAVDASGNAYVTGFTTSTDFPGVASGALQPANAGGFSDAFVAKVDATASTIVYATYLGGNDQDFGNAIALDTAGDAVVVGTTCSTNFPATAGSLQPVSLGVDCGSGNQDSFAAKLNPAGTAFVYSTFLGGEASDTAQGLAVDTAGNAYVTGFTNSTSFTGVTAGSFQPANPGGYAAFVTKINAAGSAAGYSTFLGGNDSFGFAIALDSATNAYVTGRTDDPGFPIVNAATLQPEPAGRSDGFVTKIAASGASLGFSTYFGGTEEDAGHAIVVEGTSNSVYVTGQSFSGTLPGVTPSSIQPSGGAPGVDDAFLVRIVPAAILSITKTPDVSVVDPGNKITYTLAYQNVGELNATGASLTETVPDNTVFRPTQSTAGWVCTPDANAGSACTLALGTVAVGASGSATFTVKLKSNVSASGSRISNTACAHPGPNCSTAQTPTTAAPILSITKTANFTEAKPGNVLRYTIKAFNTGNQDAFPVTITDTVPANAVFDAANSTAGWSCSPDNSAGSVCTFPVGTLATGDHATVVFAADLSTLYSNTACVQVSAGVPEFRSPKAPRSSLKALPAPACSTATTPLK